MKRFLIGQLGSFGDCLYATTIARQIKHDFPDSHVTWAISRTYSSILKLNPYVDQVWEIDIPAGLNYKDGVIWEKFESEARIRKEKGEFDELVFSQIPQHNWGRFDGTIRSSILKGYSRPITVPVDPVIILSEDEIQNVKKFAEAYHLNNFNDVILFECAPASGQSQLNLDFAVHVAKQITSKRKNICFILTSPTKLAFAGDQIIDGSMLSFRENAELTKYCTFLVGCSSGITWLSTSDWAKKLPTLQLLNNNTGVYAGLNFEYEINGLNNKEVIEMVNYDAGRVIECLETIFNSNIETAKAKFNQEYKPGISNLNKVALFMHFNKQPLSAIIRFAHNFRKRNNELNNHLSLNLITFSLKWLYIKIRYNISIFLDKTIRKGKLSQSNFA